MLVTTVELSLILLCGSHADLYKGIFLHIIPRGGSRTAATFKMDCFVIIANGLQPLTIITKRPILDVAAVLDPPLIPVYIIVPCY